ncbi:hypothetical protein VM82_09695 [Pasteurella multocida]|nr:hypothetical protein VM82_09695 [Pasteurella multocida]
MIAYLFRMNKMRKIIQICESASASHAFGDCWNLTALCDDGSVWVIDGICDFKGNPKENGNVYLTFHKTNHKQTQNNSHFNEWLFLLTKKTGVPMVTIINLMQIITLGFAFFVLLKANKYLNNQIKEKK